MTPDELAARHIAVEDLCGTPAFKLAPHGTAFFEQSPPRQVTDVVLEAAALLILDHVADSRYGPRALGTVERSKNGMLSMTVETDLRVTARRKRLLGRFRALRRHYKSECGR